MKNNIFTPWSCALILIYMIVFPVAMLAQELPVEGKLSVMLGSYVIPGVGEVSTPELGNDYHLLSAKIYQKPKEGKLIACVFGGHIRTYSYENESMYGTSFGPELQLNTERARIRVGAGPLLQMREKKIALGFAALHVDAEVNFCNELKLIAVGDFEVGRLGLYSDMEAGIRFWNRAEARCGTSAFRGGEFLRLNYRVKGNVEIGATYVWSSSMNHGLEELGYSEHKRRGLGLQFEVIL